MRDRRKGPRMLSAPSRPPNDVEPFFPYEERVSLAALAEDRAWFRAHPHADHRVRPFRPGEHVFISGAWREPLAALVIRVQGQPMVVLISRPEPEDASDPWVISEGCACRAKDLRVGLVRLMELDAARAEGDPEVTLGDVLPNRTEAFRASRAAAWATDRGRALSAACDGARLSLRCAWGGSLPRLAGTVADDLTVSLALASVGSDESRCDILRRWQCWDQLHRPYFRPSRALIERLLDPGLLLDDAVPVAVPYSVFLVDVGEWPEPFGGPPAVEVVGLHRTRTTSAPVTELLDADLAHRPVSSLGPADWQAFLDATRDRCERATAAYFGLSAEGDITLARSVGPHATWSSWRAWALASAEVDPLLSRTALLLSGLAYVRVTAPRALRPGAERRRAPLPEALSLPGVRRFDVDDVPTLPRTEAAVLRASTSLDRGHLVLTRTTRAAYVLNAACGPGRMERRPVVVEEKDVRRWTRLSPEVLVTPGPLAALDD